MDKQTLDHFQKIRQRFLQKLQETLLLFDEFVGQVVEANQENIIDVRMHVHKLAGSAKTFGFPLLTDHATKIERLLDSVIGGQKPIGSIAQALTDNFELLLKEARLNISTELQTLEKPITQDHTAEIEYDYTILIADDDELVREVLTHALQDERCKVIQAENGKQAINILEQLNAQPTMAKPDLIILDVNMPEMNGFETLENIKKNAETQHIPIMMLTRSDEDQNIIKAVSSGVMDYISKPFDLPVLVAHIKNTLRRYKTHILIADDDELIRDLLFYRFQRIGYSVATAKDGGEALSSIKSRQPNIAILDIMMPGVDGFTVLKIIKADPLTAAIPVVILSAKSQQDNIIKGIEGGAHDYISKPFDIDELVARVSGILKRHETI